MVKREKKEEKHKHKNKQTSHSLNKSEFNHKATLTLIDMIVRCVFARFYHNRLSDSNSMRWCRKLLSRDYGDVHDPNEICWSAGLWESTKHRARYNFIFDTIAQKCKTVSGHFALKSESKKLCCIVYLVYRTPKSWKFCKWHFGYFLFYVYLYFKHFQHIL